MWLTGGQAALVILSYHYHYTLEVPYRTFLELVQEYKPSHALQIFLHTGLRPLDSSYVAGNRQTHTRNFSECQQMSKKFGKVCSPTNVRPFVILLQHCFALHPSQAASLGLGTYLVFCNPEPDDGISTIGSLSNLFVSQSLIPLMGGLPLRI